MKEWCRGWSPKAIGHGIQENKGKDILEESELGCANCTTDETAIWDVSLREWRYLIEK